MQDLQTILDASISTFKRGHTWDIDSTTCVRGELLKLGIVTNFKVFCSPIPYDKDHQTIEVLVDHLECIYEGWNYSKYATMSSHSRDSYRKGLTRLAKDFNLVLNWDEKVKRKEQITQQLEVEVV